MTTTADVRAPSAALPRWRKVALAISSIALTATILELGAIWYLKRFEGYDGVHLLQYEFDPYKNIRPAPYYVNTFGIHHNGQGFRYPTEVERKKPPGTYRIFLMGGSTAYGLGGAWPHIDRKYLVLRDSETISAYLERYLRQSLPGRNSRGDQRRDHQRVDAPPSHLSQPGNPQLSAGHGAVSRRLQ